MEELLSLNSSVAKKVSRNKRFDDLAVGTYIVKSFKTKNTMYGLRVLVEIDDFHLSLPPRFSDKINSEEQIEELNAKKWKMIYGGKDVAEFNKLILDFKPIVQIDLEESATEDDSQSAASIVIRKRRSDGSTSKTIKKSKLK